MNQNKLSFESEKLVVDYISFNIQGLVDRKQVERIAKYFFQILERLTLPLPKVLTETKKICFLILRTNIKFLLDITFMLQSTLLTGVALKLIFRAKMQLNSITLLNNKSLIGIFLI